MTARSRSEIESRLVNWGKWWRDPARTEETHGRARSIEHRYLPDKVTEAEHEQEKTRKKGLVPDMRDAELVMAGWKRCSGDTKKLLKWAYAMREEKDIRKICKKCDIMQDPPRYRAFDVALYRAHTEIANILATPNRHGRIAPDNSRSSPPGTTVRSVHSAPRAVRSTAKELEVD